MTGALPHEIHVVLASCIQDIHKHLFVAGATSAVSRLVCTSGLPPVCLPLPSEWND